MRDWELGDCLDCGIGPCFNPRPQGGCGIDDDHDEDYDEEDPS